MQAEGDWGEPEPAPLGETTTECTSALFAWLTPAVVPPSAEMAVEAFHALERIAATLTVWRPAESEWDSVRAVAQEKVILFGNLRDAHSSGLAPRHTHAMFGDFSDWQVYSALAAGHRQPTDATWTFVATLIAWPYLGPCIPGVRVGVPAVSYVETLAAWLREAVKNTDAMACMKRAIGNAKDPAALLASKPILGSARERALVPALRALAEVYCASQLPETNPQVFGLPDQLQPILLPTPIRKIVDPSIANAPENQGLAPEDCGAVRYVSEDGDDEGDDSDLLARHHVRLIASAREFNHLSLQWDALNTFERDTLREAIEVRFANPAQRTGSLGLSMCALLALDPSQVARLRLLPSVADAAIALDRYAVALAWCGEQIVALQSVPTPPCAYQRPLGAPQQLPHLTYRIVAIPDQIATVIATAGGHAGGDLLRHFPDMAYATRQAASEIRQASGARLHLGRIQRSVADIIFQQTLDECIAGVILPGARTPTGAGTYYSAILATTSYRIHQAAACSVLPWVLPDIPVELAAEIEGYYIGSQLLISREEIQKAVAALHARATSARTTGRRTIEAVAEALNYQTMHVVAGLCLTTAHRPTIAPFPHPADIAPEALRAMIVDKRGNARTVHREVPLTEAIARQVVSYRRSVAAAAGFLDEAHAELAGALRSLSDFGDQHPSTAAFSMLDRVNGRWALRAFEPDDWARYWPEWVWPLNGNRHALIQFLQLEGARREVINYLVGHAEPGQTPFGLECAVTPQQFVEEVTPFLDRAIDAFGLAYLHPMRAYDQGGPRSPPRTRPIPSFGDADPGRNRSRRLNPEELELCRRVLRDTSVRDESDPASRLEAIKALAHAEFGGHPDILALVTTLLTRWARIAGATRGPNDSAKPRTRLPFLNLGTPITRFEVRDLILGKRLRDALVTAICAFPVTAATPAKWLAYIHLSAIGLGGAHAAHFDKHLVGSCLENLYHQDGQVWLEWVNDGRLFRWTADPITALLLARFRTAFPALKEAPPVKAVRAAANELLASLSPLAGAGVDSTRQRKKTFLAAMRALHRDVVPGPLMGHMLGQRHSTPVPRSTLLRATGARLIPDAAALVAFGTPFRLLDELPATRNKDVALTALRKAISKARGSSTTGGAAAGKKGQRLGQLQADLVSLEASTGAMTPVFQIVLSRLRQLADEGGRIKEVLATSTIAEYMRPVLKFAGSTLGNQFLTADPESIEQAYRTLVLTGSDSKARERLASLEDFHEHAVLHFGAVPIDWAEVAADLPQCKTRVDANLIHRHEIVLADQLIASLVDVPTHLRLMARTALHLMADTGARFGECFRLRAIDIFANQTFMFVRNTEHGEVKSFAGTRMIPIGYMLGLTGHDLLGQLLGRARALGGEDRLTPLFCDPRDPRALVLRADVVRILAQALRLATGDRMVRPHHLRHSAVTRNYDGVVVNANDNVAWNLGAALRSILLCEVGPTRRSSQAHSQLFGHAGPYTSAIVYLHQQEFRVARVMAANLPSLTSKQVAALTGLKDDAIRKGWSSGASPQSQLSKATAARLQSRSEVDAWRGIDFTMEPPVSAMVVPVATDHLSLTHLHRLLTSHHQKALPSEALSSLHEVTQTYVKRLIANDAGVSIDLGVAPGFASSCVALPWAGYAMRTFNGLKTPPHLPSLPAITRMDTVPASDRHCHDASVFLRTFIPDQCCWEVTTSRDLSDLASWLFAIGLVPRQVEITMPCTSEEVPEAMRALAGPMADAAFTAATPRSERKRGGNSVRIRIQPDDRKGSATTVAHASYLWLVRARSAPNPVGSDLATAEAA